MKQDQINLLYEKLYLIRSVEEEIAKRYSQGKMRCPTHLSTGQEAVSAAFSLAVNKSDFAVSTHRGHAHYIGKGGNLNSMIAEIYGKATGCSRGKGGSMHLIDLDVNFMGTSAIVGNSIPIGVGIALSIQIKKQKNRISCIFLGDGSIEEGVFYESLNFAAMKELPALFICENNLYSVYSSLDVRQPKKRNIAKLAKSIGVDSLSCDGNDAIACFKVLDENIKKIKNGSGPKFIEFFTYRWREHCGPNFDNDIGYRSESEFLRWKKKDPLNNLKKSLKRNVILSIEKKINLEVQRAFEYAENSPFPNNKEAYMDVYAENNFE